MCVKAWLSTVLAKNKQTLLTEVRYIMSCFTNAVALSISYIVITIWEKETAFLFIRVTCLNVQGEVLVTSG